MNQSIRIGKVEGGGVGNIIALKLVGKVGAAVHSETADEGLEGWQADGKYATGVTFQDGDIGGRGLVPTSAQAQFNSGKSEPLTSALPPTRRHRGVYHHLYCHWISEKPVMRPALRLLAEAGKHGSHPVHVHPVSPYYRYTAKALGASMWFFLMYRAKQDGAVLLGWKHPWEH